MERSLTAAYEDLDPLLAKTLLGFTITEHYEGFRVEFCFALWSPNLEDLENGSSNTVEQCPNKIADLPAGIDPRREIERLEAEAELGTLHTVCIPPHWPGNDTQAPKWVVKCHSGSTAERLEWMKKIQ